MTPPAPPQGAKKMEPLKQWQVAIHNMDGTRTEFRPRNISQALRLAKRLMWGSESWIQIKPFFKPRISRTGKRPPPERPTA